MLAGGFEKVQEAGAALAGGHSVDDLEPKYGLVVTGVVHPDKVLKNCDARPGDALVLTKRLGRARPRAATRRTGRWRKAGGRRS